MIRSGFFNAVNGDRKYNSEDINTYLQGLVTKDGVYENVGNKLQVKALENMTISIDTGKAMTDFHWFTNDSLYNIVLDASDVTLNRYDAIVLRYNRANRETTPHVIKGANALTAKYPDIVRNDDFYDICLAYVYIEAGVSAITQSDITDTRLDTDVCGYITGLIKQVDTSQLFDQYKAACDELVARLIEWQANQQALFDLWFDRLTREVLIGTLFVDEYKKVHNTTENMTNLLIGIPNYDPTVDLLFVNIYGIMLVENEDYTITGTGETAQINFKGQIAANQKIECRVLKSRVLMQ